MTKAKKATKRRKGQSASKAMLDSLSVKRCVVCGMDVWWDDSQLPPACDGHMYVDVYMAAEESND